MKKKLALVILAAVLVLGCGGGGGSSSGGTETVTEWGSLFVDNLMSSAYIDELYTVESGTAGWGEDHLDGESIAPGGTFAVGLWRREPYPEGDTPGPLLRYDAKIMLDDSTTRYLWNFTVPRIWEVTD